MDLKQLHYFMTIVNEQQITAAAKKLNMTQPPLSYQMKLLETELTSTPGWPGLTAVKNGRVHHMDRHLYHLKPNKRWGEAYRKLEALLYADDRK